MRRTTSVKCRRSAAVAAPHAYRKLVFRQLDGALLAIGLFGMVAIGFLFARMTLVERGVALVAALCLLGEFRFSDTAGFVLTVAVVLWQWRQRPRAAVAAAERAPMPELVLGNSGAAGEWRLCVGGNCRTLSEIFGHPIGARVTTMRACER